MYSLKDQSGDNMYFCYFQQIPSKVQNQQHSDFLSGVQPQTDVNL